MLVPSHDQGEMPVCDFRTFFRQATGEDPFPYQQRLAESSQLPEVLHVPTGAGKTAAAIVGWLWRRTAAPDAIRAATPRRLFYCLPMRVLVEQTYRSAEAWLSALGLREAVDLHLLMGGAADDQWLHTPERQAILVGTQDMLLSRALNRGYGMSRFRWPAAFGLCHADSLWVVDEIQLMGAGLATTVQLEGLRRRFGTAVPAHTLWMSATLALDWLQTVDHPGTGPLLALSDQDRAHPVLAARLTAQKKLQAAEAGSVRDRAYARRLAQLVLAEHRPGTLTLVVLNTVSRAQAVHEALRVQVQDTGPELLLVHSRFRACERQQLEAQLRQTLPAAGRVVVATQVVEAGVDLSARTLFTELAPWPSLVQRFGRCNRRGEHEQALVFWLDVEDRAAAPYDAGLLAEARQVLQGLEGGSVAPAALPQVALPPPGGDVIRARDLIDLFDTSPDLSGNDVDVARFVRAADESDVQVFWRDWPREESPAETEPDRAELCPVPVPAAREFLRQPGRRAWVWDHLDETWQPVEAREIRPGLTLLVPAWAGGYRAAVGWDPASTEPVPPLPRAVSTPPEAVRDDPRSFGGTWLTLRQHTDDVVAELASLLDAVAALQPWRDALTVAARWHDAGKAHPVFQATMQAAGPPQSDALWAKAGGGPHRHRRPHFRHELASALALMKQPPDLPEPLLSLAAYLVAAHHGRVRLAIRSLPGEERPPGPGTRFALGVWEGDELHPADLGGGVQLPALTLDNLDLMEIGRPAQAPPRWLERTLALRDSPELGPFRLAYLEAVLRAADVRASAAAAAGEVGSDA